MSFPWQISSLGISISKFRQAKSRKYQGVFKSQNTIWNRHLYEMSNSNCEKAHTSSIYTRFNTRYFQSLVLSTVTVTVLKFWPFEGLTRVSIVETSFSEVGVSFLHFSPRIFIGTFSILLFAATHVPLLVNNLSQGYLSDSNYIWIMKKLNMKVSETSPTIKLYQYGMPLDTGRAA